jgi:hypothetical protein
MYTYPDVSVVCGRLQLADDQKDVLLNPIVIFEVLSPSTEQYDRGAKFQIYIYQDASTWILRDHQGLDAELKLDSIGAPLPLRLIYDGLDLESGVP